MATSTILGRIPCPKLACRSVNASQGHQHHRLTASSPLAIRYAQSISAPHLKAVTRDLVQVRAVAVGEERVGAAVVRGKEVKQPVVVIDNYDSFTYNLVQYLGDLGCEIEVYRNDEITVEELRAKKPRGILISPGPGTPQDSGISLQVVRELGPSVPLFGVCMGLQCMGEAFGGKIVRAPNGVMHGKTSPVFYDEHGEPGLLDGLPKYFLESRHSYSVCFGFWSHLGRISRVIARNYTSMKILTGLHLRVRMFVRVHEKMHEYLCEKSNPIPLTWGGYSYEG
jgi:anthranilate synthase/aminodeoxychorismate synthase-like glutamine amidotransferase